MQLLPIKIRGRGLNSGTDLTHTRLNIVAVTGTVYDDGILLGHLHLAGSTQHLHGRVLQFQTQVGSDHLAAGQHSDILEHILAAIAKAGSLNAHAGKGAAQLVQQNGLQGLALYILCNDYQLLAVLQHSLQQGQNILYGADLLIGDQDLGVVQHSFHLIGIGHHIGRNVATIELHTLNHLASGLCGLGLLYGDHAVGRYLFHGLRDQFANRLVCSRHGSHAGNIIAAANGLALFLDAGHSSVHSGLNAVLHNHGIGTGSHILHTLAYQRLSQQRSSGGAVTGIVIGLGRNFLHQLGAHILKRLLQLNLLGNGHAVVGDQRCAVLLIQYHIAALGAKGNLNGVGQLVNTGLQRLASILAINNIFCHNGTPPYSTTAKMSLTSEMVYS